MKKVKILILFLAGLAILSGCGNKAGKIPAGSSVSETAAGMSQSKAAQTETTLPDKIQSGASKTESNRKSEHKILIAYFSRVGNTDFTNAKVDAVSSASLNVVDNQYVGNTGMIAHWIQEETGGDLFLIRTKEPYPADYGKTVEIGEDQNHKNAVPELIAADSDLSAYDTVYLGYPIWNYDLPVAVDSFLESYDFSGKKIIPFCTSGGSGALDTVNAIKKHQPGAEVSDRILAIHQNDVLKSRNKVAEWIKNLSGRS